jgi:Zn-dependent metalloprotease
MKNYLSVIICLALSFSFQKVQADEIILNGTKANNMVNGADMLRYTEKSNLPDYIHFNNSMNITVEGVLSWIPQAYRLNTDYNLQLLGTETDKLGMTHYRYQQTFKGYPVLGTMYLIHSRNDRVESMNGEIYDDIQTLPSITVSETNALNIALQNVHANVYKWQLPAEKQHLKDMTGNSAATYYPSAQFTIVKKGKDYHLAYAFNIYAEEPLSRTIQYVDVATGQVLLAHQLIESITANGTAVTKFSGTKSITTDSVSAYLFHLRDATRGLGIKTLNLNHTNSYGTAVDFNDSDDYWNNVNANQDQAATDAHWGSEMTYDYYWNIHNRNSIDNAGLSLNSYVHYNNNYTNAFWNGTEMTYGDGQASQGFLIFTALDVCGHEITHGLTSYTANLGNSSSGNAECDALNEGFSDIFGTAIERYARPTQWDWIIGGDFTCTASGVQDHAGLRTMSNPNQSAAGSLSGVYPQPSCYQGTYWSTMGEPHQNDGPLIYWFYLLSTGDTASNITALGVDTAASIAYRTLTIHLTPNATYNDTRFYSILSSSELFGGCSIPTKSTTNAWHKVCVGTAYSNTLSCDFGVNAQNSCKDTLHVNFTNLSVNGNSYYWDFGDGNTSTAFNPSHTYQVGTYTVKLVNNGGSCGVDSTIKTAYIHVAPPVAPIATTGATILANQTATIHATPASIMDSIYWFDAPAAGNLLGSGTSYTTPPLTVTTTYYAAEGMVNPPLHVGPATNTFGTGANYNNNSRYLIFDCAAPVHLISVLVYAQNAGFRTIELRDNNGNVIQSDSFNINQGPTVVPVNFQIPAGTGLQLGLSQTSAVNLYRNNAGATYPYTNGPISITANSAGNGSYYYFFYDWVIKGEDCISPSLPTVVTVNPNSIDETLNQQGIHFYPNPTNDQLNIRFDNQAFEGDVDVYNMTGQMVFKTTTASTHALHLNTTNWANGNYLIRLTGSQINARFKVMKTATDK